jgi:hypothetical protein
MIVFTPENVRLVLPALAGGVNRDLGEVPPVPRRRR